MGQAAERYVWNDLNGNCSSIRERTGTSASSPELDRFLRPLGGAGLYPVDRAWCTPYGKEFSIHMEHEIAECLSVRGSYVYKRSRRGWDDSRSQPLNHLYESLQIQRLRRRQHPGNGRRSGDHPLSIGTPVWIRTGPPPTRVNTDTKYMKRPTTRSRSPSTGVSGTTGCSCPRSCIPWPMTSASPIAPPAVGLFCGVHRTTTGTPTRAVSHPRIRVGTTSRWWDATSSPTRSV